MIAINDSEGSENGGAPTWIRLLGVGRLDTRDGRGPFFVKDPEAIVAATLAQKLEKGLPVDFDHASDYAAPRGMPAPAAAWITAIEVRPDGIWGKCNWTEAGRRAVSHGADGSPPQWRYISPVFTHADDGTVECLLRAAVTNNPNMFRTAINSRSRGKSMQTTAEKIAALKAEMAADALSEAEVAICVQTGVSHSDFRAARNERRQIALNAATATTVKIEPFVIDRVPSPRFVGI